MDQFFYLFSGLRWQDIFDIGLNSYILFRFYVLFRGTNVIRVLLAVCVLWLVSRAAIPLGLVITSWAMQGVITVAAFIIIIIFRNEISSVLQTKNFKSFFWGIPRHQFHTPLNIIAEAVYELAQKKIGALIVLPLKKSMENVVQGGVVLNGKLSKELLVSIFWPNNPVHDGAVIIEGDKITRAGVILPLSQEKDFPSRFGTRHRAALGVTELTDALVIVVSEERGKISLFREKQIYEIPDRPALEKFLEEHTTDGSRQKGFRRQSVELTTAAVISLVFTAGLWMNFSKGMETLATYTVPIEFMMPDQKMEIVSSSASKIDLLVSGSRPLISSITPEQIKVKFNLSSSVAGTNRLSVTNENIVLPPGVRLKTIKPTSLDVILDMLTEKELPVQPNWTGKLPEGYIMESAKMVPPAVRVIGQNTVLEETSTVFTEKISIDRLSNSGTVEARLVFDPPSLKPVGPDKIKIQYIITAKGK
ncbi:MAG: diadenylate cyclase [Proteobacteria bacterium]|nr:diadenylate cyclase [Pseudomonadota bacterium]MBU1389942.1 diadenylate cyclase [Pseudomonadota bacterium]MBU1542541.1 diadenylate cyclase [Pseudomonadota bacterium]MBU2479710.1 diadenylate cyclase [Pseudomonadota bacterium]